MSQSVELEAHVGIHLATKKEVVHEQYFIFVCEGDERQKVGLIGWKEDSKIIFFQKIDEVAAKWIEGEVAKILDRENVSSIEPPLLPEELLIKDDSDELDEEAIIG
jgi:hypothetical protein